MGWGQRSLITPKLWFSVCLKKNNLGNTAGSAEEFVPLLYLSETVVCFELRQLKASEEEEERVLTHNFKAAETSKMSAACN